MAWPLHIIAACGYVFDREGRMLLVKTHHRGWDGPGGQVENGETVEKGLLREILEESGIVASVGSLVGIYSNVGEHLAYDGHTKVPTKLMLDFLCEYISGEPTPSEETSEVAWVPREHVLSFISHPTIRYRVEKALAYQGRAVYASYVTHPSFALLTERFV